MALNSGHCLKIENTELEEKEESKKKRYYRDFSENTSLHGVKYTGESERNIFERIWWGIMVLISMCICIYLVHQLWNKWESSPVIVSFDETLTPVWKIPFPAITVCPMSKTLSSKFNYTDVCDKDTITDKDLVMFSLVSYFCETKCHTKFKKSVDFVKDSAIAKYKNISLEYNDIFLACTWIDGKSDCSDYFTPIMTEEGLCYTANMLNADELYTNITAKNPELLNNKQKLQGWTIEDGYTDNEPYETYPARANAIGTLVKLFLTNYKNNTDYKCAGINKGFKIAIHPPHILPKVSRDYLWAPYKTTTNVVVKPEMMITSDGLKSYKPEKRQCFFPDERKLRFFKNYTRENCELECSANYTLALCGCVNAIMPRENSTRICAGAIRKKCVKEVNRQLSIIVLESPLPANSSDEKTSEKLKAARKDAFKCNCLQTCTTLTYEPTVFQTKLDWDKYLQNTPQLKDDENIKGFDVSVVSIYLNKPQFIMSKRSELYGITDFLANCGGLLGVCLGFSILSLVEIIYFFIIRFFCDMRKKLKPKNKESSNMPDNVKESYQF